MIILFELTKGKECDCRIESSDCFCVNQKKEEKKKGMFLCFITVNSWRNISCFAEKIILFV